MSTVAITYNSYDLQTTASAASTIMSRDILYRSLPQKNIILKQDTIRDSFDVVSVNYSQKIITVRGLLKSDSQTNLKTLRDAFMSALGSDEKNLDINDGSGIIRYKASVQSIDVPEEFFNITILPFEISFLAEPFGKATSTTSANLNSGGAISASPYNESVSITGTYKAKPTITITINTETDMTAFKWDNVTTGDWIQVSATFSNGDVVVIDCEDETVKLNGTDQDFTGVFPNFDSGSNSLILTVTATLFNLNASFSYYPTYL